VNLPVAVPFSTLTPHDSGIGSSIYVYASYIS
jgi:hypothetical protein